MVSIASDAKTMADRASLKSASSCRQALHDVLAEMQPSVEKDLQKIGPPVDFSFRDLRKVTDVCKCEPREGPTKYVKVPVKSEDQEEPLFPDEKDKKNEEAKQYYKYYTKAIRLSNNSISRYDNFKSGLQSVLGDPEAIQWIDLSFNDLTEIGNIIVEYPNLKVLYLHANYIDDLKQIDKLAALPNLKTLTLHGNMIEERKGYRQYVITTIPQLQYFDFSRITKADREKAKVWKSMKLIESSSVKRRKAKPAQ